MSKSFIQITDLSKTEIFALFELANQLETGTYKEKPLQGKRFFFRHRLWIRGKKFKM